jgi:Protein of unknown function (DUF3039)
MLDCSLRSRGSRFEVAAFLTHSQTGKRVCSFARPGQRRAILGAWNPPTSSSLAEERTASTVWICSLRSLSWRTRQLAQNVGARFPTLAGMQLSRLANVSQQASPGTRTIVDERTQERPDYRTEEGDHERFSHYVAKDKLTEAMVLGTPVVALCGKVWVPSRDPERFPVCPECREIWESLDPGADD